MVREFLAREKLAICWAVVGEKLARGADLGRRRFQAALRLSGAYLLGDKGPEGFLKCMFDDPEAKEAPTKPARVLRSGS